LVGLNLFFAIIVPGIRLMKTTLSFARSAILFFGLLSFALAISLKAQAGDALSAFSRLNQAGLIVLDGSGRTLMANHADLPLMPASTTKLATAWLALSHWGENHRFKTSFHFDQSTKTLWVKGSGDPYLVSEELTIIARNLRQKGITQISAIGIDTSLFQPGLILPGTGTTDNPYDAVPSAVAANFNTINVRRIGGRVVSAEQHTPITPFSDSFGRTITSGELRVNTGRNPLNAARYFGELLGAFLREQSVNVGSDIQFGQITNQPVIYTHENSKSLSEIVRNMLKYSTNFVANQLTLILSAETYQRPANAADVQRYMEETLSQHFGWRGFSLADGAGLSRTNRLSPHQLTELVQAFARWKHLLHEVEPGIFAKTGTLTGVSALAGFLVKRGEWQPFAVIMNEKVPYNLRNRIAKELAGS
jgi:D-alanyl-D-alanine carboxypeptidase/D-alanyl-D-alanine-endopeptidase (penicillin-binding protein 4)